MQADLFSQTLRDTGMVLAAEAQERTAPAWADRAYSVIRSLAERQRTVHVDDVLREFTEQPEHTNAWGAVWMRAIREGLIEHSGRVRPSSDAKKHRHQYPIYFSNVCGRAA